MTANLAGITMPTCYRLDLGQSRFTVQAFATGLLSFMGHSPTFAVREGSGQIVFSPEESAGNRLVIAVPSTALELVDNVRPNDRREIEQRMRTEVLETSTYPAVRFDSETLAATPTETNRYRVQITGHLSLHGTTQPLKVDAELQQYPDGVRLLGQLPLSLSGFHIRPVTALAGAIRLQDQLHIVFDLVCWKEAA